MAPQVADTSVDWSFVPVVRDMASKMFTEGVPGATITNTRVASKDNKGDRAIVIIEYALDGKTGSYGFDYEKIEERLKELDKENKFKYDNRVDKTLAIEDPLVAKTLFDTEHILNPFTISKAELRISDATTSSIDIIQNR